MIESCNIFYEDDPEYAVICIPGRCNDGASFAKMYQQYCEFKNTVFVGPTPKGYAWYPMPFSAVDQDMALAGLPRARKAVESVVKAVQDKFDIPKSKIALVGFSAGGVMAIETAAYSDLPYAAVVSHSGAILEPRNLPECRHPDMPVILTHNRDDECFEWYERYLPMRNALIDKKYLTFVLERAAGGHRVLPEDVEQVTIYLSENGFTQPADWDGNDWLGASILEEVTHARHS